MLCISFLQNRVVRVPSLMAPTVSCVTWASTGLPFRAHARPAHCLEPQRTYGEPFQKAVAMVIFAWYFSLGVRKPTIWVSDEVRHKPGCTVIEESFKLEISDLEKRGILHFCVA